MSQPSAEPEKTEPAPVAEKVYLVSYPKIIFAYPTLLYSLFAGVFMYFKGDAALTTDNTAAVVTGLLFLAVFFVNLTVFTFDFPRATSLTLFLFLAAVVLGLFLLFTLQPQILPSVTNFLKMFHPLANSTFYFGVATILALLLIAVSIIVRFDYWEVRPNELMNHHGFLSDLKRFPAPNLRVDKEINDVFEYMLFRSGRLILHPSGESRAIVLDNVLFIDRKEAQLTRMLGALQVQVRSPGVSE